MASSTLRTPPGVLSFPNLFKARAAAEGQDPKFSGVLIFDKAAQNTPEYKAMRLAVQAAIKEKWGDAKATDPKFIKRLRLPFRDCADKADTAGYDVEGGVFVSATSKQPPGVVDGSLYEMVESDVWPGQIARFSVRAFAYEVSGNAGVSFGLNNVQIIKKDMAPIAGKRRAEDDFDRTDPDTGGTSKPQDDDDDLPF